MILFEIAAVGLILSLISGGSLRRLRDERLSGEWILLLVLPLQLSWPRIIQAMGFDCGLSIILWLVMMGLLAGVLLWNAPRRWTLALAGLGISLNVLVIGLNGAMPVSVRASSEIGYTRTATLEALDSVCLHEPLDSETLLTPLADVIAVPGPSWQRGVISIGDLLLATGLAAWLFKATRLKR